MQEKDRCAINKLLWKAGNYNIDQIMVYHLIYEFGFDLVEDSINSYIESEEQGSLPDFYSGKHANYVFYKNVEAALHFERTGLTSDMEEYLRDLESRKTLRSGDRAMIEALRKFQKTNQEKHNV